MANHYKALQIDPKARPEVVKAAFHAMAKLYANNEDKLRPIIAANEVLSDSKKRATYDESCEPKGKIIGNYKLLSKIAEGGFGITYKAVDITVDCPVCIKHAMNISPEDEELLLAEARAMWSLRHFGIPSIKHVLRMPDDSLSLVMDYIPGKTLAQIVEEHGKGLDCEHVAWIAQRVLNILRYLHMHGIIHGDVKPQNIIVQEEHTVVLVDYGLSAVKPSRTTTAKGYTPYFASPEQMDGKVLIPESDLYSLGMTMIFALGGDVAHVSVPASTTPEMCKFIKSLVRREPLSRPKIWKENLCDEILRVRKADFGRTESGMKPLPVNF
jgi:serine/threonine protein kinase